jgi:hypothetical protein
MESKGRCEEARVEVGEHASLCLFPSSPLVCQGCSHEVSSIPSVDFVVGSERRMADASSDRERFISTIPGRYPRCGAGCPGTFLSVLMIGVKCSCFRAKAAQVSGLYQMLPIRL